MKSRARVLVLCLLCVARASVALPSEEITEIEGRSAAHIQDLSNISVQETNGTDKQAADKLRDKRALGLLLSGLAQIFGYTVTPIQIATLPNPNITIPAAMSSLRPQVASSRPTNITAPRQRETIRFTGVLNFGNNSDILGHLQRYEQMFHRSRNNTTTMTTLRPPPNPTLLPPARVTLDPKINPPPTKPPLLAPFFVKIPLPIAPELLSAAIPEDLTLSYPAPAITIVGESNVNAEPLIRKEQETVYKNEDSVSEQRARGERLKEQEKHRNREKPCRDDETRERYKDREEEIDNRNRQQASKQKSTEKKRPTHDDEDEDSAEKYEDEPKSPRGSSRRPPEKNNEDKAEDYPDRDESDERNKQFSGYQQPENFDKYIEATYNNRPLPIGDYFHEGNPEVIRDSYGEVLDGKKLEDDKLAEFINMFKHPHTDTYASQEVRDAEDASGEDGKEESSADDYNEHLARLQKLREEYAPPENKYEEYDLNDERKTDRNDRKSERNRASTGSKKSKTGKQTIVNTENGRRKLPTVSRNKDGSSNNAVRIAAQQDIDFGKYTPLIVPVRYIDVNDKLQQATMQQLNYKRINKYTNQSQSIDNHFPKISSENKMESTVTTLQEKFPQAIFPEKARQLHEGEYKELQVFPPPFDYAYDNTKPESVIVPANLQINHPNYRPIVKSNANNDKSSQEDRSGYSVVIANPVYPVYRYPQNVYYYSNGATNQQNQASHLNVEGAHPQHQIYVPQQSNNQQFIQANPNLTEYNLNETAKNSYHYYYQPQEIPASVLDRYRYIFGEQASQAEESSNIDVRSQIPNAENWSNRIYRPQTQSDAVEQSFLSHPQRQSVAASNYNTQSKPSERPRNMQPNRQNSKPEEQRKNIETTEIPLRQFVPTSFDDPQTAHDFFGFSKNDYSFKDESNDESTFTEENDKTAKESHVLVAPEPVDAHYNDESIAKHVDELENDPEKAKVKEYRNRVATLRVSEQRQTRPNGPIHYVDFIRNI